MNSSKKESIAITAIINETNKFDNLQDDLRKRDKEPVWDGILRLYQKDTNKSDEIVGIIPVQVKGTEGSKETKKESLNYSVKISDIENYKKDKKGAIFFVVEVLENRDTTIYYKMFDLKTIDEVLIDVKKGQKTKRFNFQRLNKNQLVSLCVDFIKKLDVYEDIVQIKKVEVYDKKTVCYDYNTKYEYGEMKKSNEVFFETNAYKEAKEKLEKQNVIILHGEPWVGKTSTARKLVTNYINQGYVFLYGNVDDLVDIKNKVSMDGKMICLLDDFLGSNVRYLEKNVAESTLDKIIHIFKNSKDKKLILTTRTYIYNNCKKLFYKFYNATGIKDEYLIDVADYNYMEKGSILYNHLQKNNILGTINYNEIIKDKFYEKIIKHDNFNPGVISLICERMKDKQIANVKKYITDMLNDPERLWESEYQKLSEYEKIILTIIALFEVKVPEKYVKEQFEEILKIENINIVNTDIFEKAIDMLSISFIKITFNEDDERELSVCKHSVGDYIISKIKKEQINIERYINSAKYIEILSYINTIVKDDELYREKLAKKVEKDFEILNRFWYNKMYTLYDILKQCLNPERLIILQKIIMNAFSNYNMNLIVYILENEYDVLRDFTVAMFKKYVIDYKDDEYLYYLRDILECEEYFKTCLEILEYQKNSEYMLEVFDTVKEILIDIVTENVENTINEISIEYVARDIIEGKNREEIIKSYILASINDEMPSLRRLYSKDKYQELVKCLYENCYVYIDETQLQATIMQLKGEIVESSVTNKRDLEKENPEHIEYIRKKFEDGYIQENDKKDNENEIDLLGLTRRSMYGKWWLECFRDNYFIKTSNIELYHEFTNRNQEVDYSLKSFGKEFLNYILHEKNKISSEAENILNELAYKSFINGINYISQEQVRFYELECTDNMKELYSTQLIKKEGNKITYINDYIYLYMAVNELIKQKDNLMKIIDDWNIDEDDENDSIVDMKQKIFQLYSELNTKEFNEYYVIPALSTFANVVEIKRKTSGKMGVSRAIIEILQLGIGLDEKFDMCWNINIEHKMMWLVNFVTGVHLEWDIGWLDYSIYKDELYEYFYNKEEEMYEIDFNEVINTKELREIFAKLKVWDYIYDIYCETVKILEQIEKDNSLNVYNIAKEKLEQKYYI